MAKHLRPDKLDAEVRSSTAENDFKHWFRTFNNYLTAVKKQTPDTNELDLLICFVTPTVYAHIAEEATYGAAIKRLEKLYVKKKNVVCARYLLLSKKQEAGQSIDDFVTTLHQLTKDCNFQNVTAAEYSDQMVLNAFISGLSDASIRQRLLESDDLTFEQAYDKARVFELAKKNSDKYTTGYGASVSSTDGPMSTPEYQDYHQDAQMQSGADDDKKFYKKQSAAIRTSHGKNRKKYCCYFCGKSSCKKRSTCPALHEECDWCHKIGHFEDVCLKKKQDEESNKGKSAAVSHFRPTMAAAGESFNKTVLKTVLIDNTITEALFDTGSTMCFISEECAKRLALDIHSTMGSVKLADGSSKTLHGECIVSIKLEDERIDNVRLFVLPTLAADVIVGTDVMELFQCVSFHFGGKQPTLHSNAVSNLVQGYPVIFKHLTEDCHPIAVKSRSYSKQD